MLCLSSFLFRVLVGPVLVLVLVGPVLVNITGSSSSSSSILSVIESLLHITVTDPLNGAADQLRRQTKEKSRLKHVGGFLLSNN